MTRSRWILLLLLMAGQAWLSSTVFLPAPHNGGDNAGYVALGNALASGDGYVESWDPERPAHTKYPPVFPLLLAALITLGATSWGTLKLVAFGSSILVTGATFLWASRRTGLWPGVGIALLTGFGWSMLWHSSMVLSDVPFLAFTVLALWAIDEVMRHGEEGRAHRGWLIAAGVAAFLAYFTRSAGLPLVVAILAALVMRKQLRAAAVLAAGVGVPAVAWLIRGVAAGSDEGRYASEFLLINPYDPGLGTAGPADFVARVTQNARGYLFDYLPTAFSGSAEGIIVPLTVAVTLLGVAGWAVAVVRKQGPAELFFPMYLGLLLIWPQVWSGDRFVLPLIPLLLLYAFELLRRVGSRIREGMGEVAAAALALALIIPMIGGWRTEVTFNQQCRAVAEEIGPWGCSGRPSLAFAMMSRWAGVNLEPGTVVLTRKPRIFHVLSGLPSRTYPFDDDPQVLFDQAEELGARYLILDGIGNAGIRYVGSAVARHPERFCQVVGVGDPGTPGQTDVLGIFTAEEAAARLQAFAEAEQDPTIVTCPEGMRGRGERISPIVSGSIPLLDGSILAASPAGSD